MGFRKYLIRRAVSVRSLQHSADKYLSHAIFSLDWTMSRSNTKELKIHLRGDSLKGWQISLGYGIWPARGLDLKASAQICVQSLRY